MDETFHDEALNCSSFNFDHCYELPPAAPSKDDDEDYMEVPLSPDSRKYQMKMSMLQEKYDEMQSSNEMLRNRVMQVKKEITQHERLKRMLVYTLESHGDKYYKASLDFPPPKEAPRPVPTKEDLERERRKRERKERDRLREKARKAARRELLLKAKLDVQAEMQIPGTEKSTILVNGHGLLASTPSAVE